MCYKHQVILLQYQTIVTFASNLATGDGTVSLIILGDVLDLGTPSVDSISTAKTSPFTATSGDGFFVNTTSGAVAVTLPAVHQQEIFNISDYANTN